MEFRDHLKKLRDILKIVGELSDLELHFGRIPVVDEKDFNFIYGGY